MRTRNHPTKLIPTALLLALSACGEPQKSLDRSSPQTVVDAWLAAAKTGDKAAMLELFVPTARDAEGQGEKNFTAVVGNLGVRLTSADVSTPMNIDGDKAKIAYGAHFRDKDGKDNKDGLRFALVKQADGWFIESLR